VLIASRMAGGI